MFQGMMLARSAGRGMSSGAIRRIQPAIVTTATTSHHDQDANQWGVRGFASRGRSSAKSFQPRRRPHKNYRPFKSKDVMGKRVRDHNPHIVTRIGQVENPKNDLQRDVGHVAAEIMNQFKQDQALLSSPGGSKLDPAEERMRLMDYMTAEPGSTEALTFERRAMEYMTEEEKKDFLEMREDITRKAQKFAVFDEVENTEERILKQPKPKKGAEFDHLFMNDEEYAEFYAGDERDPADTNFEPNRRAHGEWTNMVVDVRRGVHLWRGGRLETYRAMVIGGNLNGCGGFGVGSHKEPVKAVAIASRRARRNIFFVDRYNGNGLTRDLVGRQNSCRVVLRAVDNGLRGNPLIKEILLRFGITNCSCKAFGKRHLWSVVRATFKALCTHESVEDIAMKRGRRILTIDRALRMKV